MATNSSLNNQITSADFTIAAGNLKLPTTSATVGQIQLNAVPWFHGYGTGSLFIGENAGNLTFTTAQAINNIAIGYYALNSITGGATGTDARNIAIGFGALRYLTGSTNAGYMVSNVAIGPNAMGDNLGTVSASYNIFIGDSAGSHISGGSNVGIGYQALQGGGNGNINNNTSVGYNALKGTGQNTGGNCAFGYLAMANGGYAPANYTAIGREAGYNIGNINQGVGGAFFGYRAGYAYTGAESDNICIGYNVTGTVGESNKLRIGAGTGTSTGQLDAAFISGIYNTTVGATAGVVLADSTNQIGGLAGAANTIFIGGAAPSFSASPQCTSLTLTGVLNLPTTSATVGQIKINSQIWAHAYASTYSVYLGQGAGNQTLSGTYNVGIGGSSLNKITSGGSNVGIGNGALFSCTTSGNNVGIGNNALVNLTTAANGVNVAIGYNAMNGVTIGGYNLALGFSAGSSCVTGSENSNIYLISTGVNAESNAIRIGITGSGGGQQNKAYICGTYATGATPSGTAKVALIDNAELHYGLTNTTSALLTVAAAGTAPTWSTGPTISGTMSAASFATTTAATIATLSGKTITMSGSDTDVGLVVTPKGAGGLSLTTGTVSAASFATTTAATITTLSGKTITMSGSDTDVSLVVVPKGAGTITCLAIYSKIVTGNAVLVDSSGNLGVVSSSERYKEHIKDMNSSSDKIFKLRPVTFNYKLDDEKKIQYGLIAEEVVKIFPELISYDKDGDPMSVQYHLLPAMLLNEIQKLVKRVEFLEVMLDSKDLR